jgi:hypothetical protein
MATNPFDAIIARDIGDEARDNLARTDINPNDAARANRMSRVFGVSPLEARTQLPVLEQQAQVRRAQDVLEVDPSLAPWLSNPDNAAAARDDLDSLMRVSRDMQPWTPQQRQAFVDRTLGRTPDRSLNPISPAQVRQTYGAQNRGSPLTAPNSALPYYTPDLDGSMQFSRRRLNQAEIDEQQRGRADLFLGAGGFLGRVSGGLIGAVPNDNAIAFSEQAGRNFASMWGSALNTGLRAAQGFAQFGSELLGFTGNEQTFNDAYQRRSAFERAITPTNLNTFGRGLYSGGQSIALMSLGFATGNPLSFLSLVSGGDAYGRFRERGVDPGTALAGGVATGLIEAATEYLPTRWLGGRFGEAGARGFLTRFLLADVAGEQVATASQNLVDVLVGRGLTWQQYQDTFGEQALETFIATLTMGAAVGGPHIIASRLAREERTADDMRTALTGQATLDSMAETAQGSSLRTNDPVGFKEFVESLAQNSPIRSVYIPVEAIEAYAQTEGADLTWLAGYEQQMQEATQTGGDLVMPLADAMTYLAPTKAWQQLREDIRVTAGGLSGRETRTLLETFNQTLEQRGAELAAEAKAATEAATPFVELYQSVRQQMVAAGFDPKVADANAQILAARYERLATERYGNANLEEALAAFPLPTFQTAMEPGAPPNPQTKPKKGRKKKGSVENPTNPSALDAGPAPTSRMPSETLRQEQQGGETVTRGQTDLFSDGSFVVTLFATADRSTLIHELGHVFLEQEFRAAGRDGANAELTRDVDALKKWFADNGHPVEGDRIPVEAHELFARGMERYVMEGRAPTAGLRPAFAKFRSWLMRIYQVVENLRSPITPDVREVMARMLATQAEIDAEQDLARPIPLEELQRLGMTEAEIADYMATASNARDEAFDQLLFKTMEAIRRREQEKFAAARRAITEEVTARINAIPEFVAQHLLRTGNWLGQPDRAQEKIKLNSAWLMDTFGEDVLKALPGGVPMYRADGVHGDIVAEMVGAQSGEALVRALLELNVAQKALKESGDNRSVRDKAIADEVETVMAERYGDVLTDGQIEEEAMAAVNEANAERLAAELRLLRRRNPYLDRQDTPYRVAREWAKRKVRAEKVQDVLSRQAIQRYRRAMAKAQTQFEEALLAKDDAAAFKAKQTQLLNHALLAEAKIAADEVDVIVKRMQRYSKRAAMQSVDQDYFDRVHELLERFDFRPRTNKWLNEAEQFEAWAAKQAEQGFEVLTPPRLQRSGQHYSRVSANELFDLDDAVSSIMTLGKLKQRLVDAQGERDFAEAVQEGFDSLASLPDRNLPENAASKQDRKFLKFMAGGLKAENIFDALDNFVRNRIFNRLGVQGATNAENERAVLREMAIEPVARMLRENKKMFSSLGDHVTAKTLRWRVLNEGDPRVGELVTMTRGQWIMVAANLGNLSNLEKMIAGEKWGSPQIVEDEVNAILTKEEWDLVNAMWRSMDSLWPHVVRVEREMSGVAPEGVVPREVLTPHGPYQGGYWPVVYDNQRSGIADRNEQDAFADLFGARSGIATPKGHTITRTDAVGPINYRLEEVLMNAIEQRITRIAYAQWARDMQRYLKTPKIRGMIDTKMGPEYRQQIEAWMRRVVNGNMVDKRGAGAYDEMFRKARTRMTVVAMGFAYSTVTAQTLGLGNTIGRIGPKYTALGLKRAVGWSGLAGAAAGGIAASLASSPFLAGPGALLGGGVAGSWGAFQQAKEFVFTRSPEMARRGQELDRDMLDAHRQLQGKNDRRAQIANFSMMGIGLMDRYGVAFPTWLGAHQKGLDEGLSDAQASAYADKMVRLTQGSGREKDLSAWQSPNNEAAKFWTMFYTPFNVLFNAQWEMGRHWKSERKMYAAQMAFWFIVATSLGDAMLAGDWPEDEDGNGLPSVGELASWFLRNGLFGLFAGIPYARDVGNVTERQITGRYAQMTTPLGRIFDEGTTVAQRTFDWDEEGLRLDDRDTDGAAIKNTAEMIGLIFRLPTGQAGRTGGFLYDAFNGTGQEEPQDFRDWYSGIAYGRVPENREDR